MDLSPSSRKNNVFSKIIVASELRCNYRAYLEIDGRFSDTRRRNVAFHQTESCKSKSCPRLEGVINKSDEKMIRPVGAGGQGAYAYA